MCRAGEISSSLRRFPGNWRVSFGGPFVVAIARLLLAGNTRAFGATVADLDPSQHYRLEKIDLSGESAFSRDALLSVMTTKERPWYEVWKPLPDFDSQTFTDDLAHIQRFCEAHGYYNAHVIYDLTLNKNKLTPHITVVEGKPIRVAAIEVKVVNVAPAPQEVDRSFTLKLNK